MQLTPKDIDELKTILAACKVIGVESVVITEGLARGATPSMDAAIISTASLSISEALRLGIGRVSELDKRLSIFSGPLQLEGKSNEAGDVSLLTISSGKSKVQFRCTSVKLMRYPKSNDDVPFALLTLAATEVQQLSRAVKTLGAETVVLHVARDGTAKVECADSTNDRFDLELASPAKFLDEPDGAVNTYLAGLLVDVLDAAAKGWESITFVLGQAGSITTDAKRHTLLVMPRIGD